MVKCQNAAKYCSLDCWNLESVKKKFSRELTREVVSFETLGCNVIFLSGLHAKFTATTDSDLQGS